MGQLIINNFIVCCVACCLLLAACLINHPIIQSFIRSFIQPSNLPTYHPSIQSSNYSSNLNNTTLVSSKYATLDELNFKVLSMGPNYPQIDAYQLVYDTQREACAFRVRCSWQDVFKMELESSLRLGGLVCLPFVLGAEVRHLRFTAQLQFIAGQNEQDDDDEEAFVEIFCLPDDAFLLELDVGSLVGHRTKLKDLPKITAGIVEGIKKVLTETLIYPRSVKIPLKLLSALNFSASASASDNVDCRSESCPEAEAEAEAVVVEGEADVVEAESDAELFADAGSEALDQTDDESLPFLSLSAVNSLGRTCSTINGEQESAM